MPIPWVSPSEAIVSQSYLQNKTLKVKPFDIVLYLDGKEALIIFLTF